jgi:hypothetical protein
MKNQVIFQAKKTKLEKVTIFLSVLVFIFPFLQFLHVIPIKLDSKIGELMWGGLLALAAIFCVLTLRKTEKEPYLLPAVLFFLMAVIKLLQGFSLLNLFF